MQEQDRENSITISVCMIVRDEEAVLERCLQNAVQFADELIIVDTGSTDGTKKIAFRYTQQVYDYPWQKDFAAARNVSYEKAVCDYVMWLDADDDLEPEDILRILDLKKNMPPQTDVVFFTYTGDSDDENIFADAELVRDRLVRRDLAPKWIYPIHEVIELPSGWKRLYRPDIRIFHRKVKNNEERRNICIFETKMAEGFQLNPFNRSYYCRELCSDRKYEEAVREFEILKKESHWAEIDYALFFYIESMKKLKRYEQLKNDLEAYLETYSSNEMVLCVLGDLYQREKNYHKAIIMYQQAQAAQVQLTDGRIHFPAYRCFLPWLGISKAYLRMNQTKQAKSALDKARQIHPHNLEVKLLSLYLEGGNIK